MLTEKINQLQAAKAGAPFKSLNSLPEKEMASMAYHPMAP